MIPSNGVGIKSLIWEAMLAKTMFKETMLDDQFRVDYKHCEQIDYKN